MQHVVVDEKVVAQEGELVLHVLEQSSDERGEVNDCEVSWCPSRRELTVGRLVLLEDLLRGIEIPAELSERDRLSARLRLPSLEERKIHFSSADCLPYLELDRVSTARPSSPSTHPTGSFSTTHLRPSPTRPVPPVGQRQRLVVARVCSLRRPDALADAVRRDAPVTRTTADV